LDSIVEVLGCKANNQMQKTGPFAIAYAEIPVRF
jgi:hypothetical protein